MGELSNRTSETRPPRDPFAGWITQGQEALDRVAKCKPAWGMKVEGLQVGIGRLRDEDQFQPGEWIPLEFYIRNVSDKTMNLSFSLEFFT
jgi:hypothetical protein